MDFVTVSGVTLHTSFAETEGNYPLVFINSLGTDLRIWDKVVAHFAGRNTLVRYDKRGHGLSDCPPAPYSLRDHALDLAGLLDHLNLPPVVLVGISVGGMIALDFTTLRPERVQALVLCNTAPKIGSAEMWNERITNIRRDGMAAHSDAILTRWFAPSFQAGQPATYQGYKNMLDRMPVAGYTGTCAAIRDADLTEMTRKITLKTLVISGAADQATPPALVRGLCALLPQAQYQEISGAGHLTCVEQPEVVAAHITKFLA